MSALLALLLACGGKQAPVEEPAPVEAPAPEPAEPPPAPEPTALVGDWVGAPCGAREYERWLTLTDDHTWAAEDRISPCPEGATCVWSGIVRSKGTWAVDGARLSLTETESGGEQGQPRPTSLAPGPTADEATGTESDAPCPYTRKAP